MDVLFVDDHQLFLDGVRHILLQLDNEVNVIEANTASAAIDFFKSDFAFDLILLDLAMPGVDGIDLFQRIQSENMLIPVVVVSAEDKPMVIKYLIDNGAMGFIPKSHSADQMLIALCKVLNGDIYIPCEIRERIKRVTTKNKSDYILRAGISRRQYDVLLLMAKGYSNQQIAEALNRTEHTVKSHVSALFQILSVKNRTECVQLAVDMGLFSS